MPDDCRVVGTKQPDIAGSNIVTRSFAIESKQAVSLQTDGNDGERRFMFDAGMEATAFPAIALSDGNIWANPSGAQAELPVGQRKGIVLPSSCSGQKFR